jgi:transcriptional regulator with XRE-family HTH domain
MDSEARKQLGDSVRYMRTREGWTQADLCAAIEKAYGGRITLTRSTLARIEAGDGEPGFAEGIALAEVFDVPIWDLLPILAGAGRASVLRAQIEEIEALIAHDQEEIAALRAELARIEAETKPSGRKAKG